MQFILDRTTIKLEGIFILSWTIFIRLRSATEQEVDAYELLNVNQILFNLMKYTFVLSRNI
jgi:hypothetical protein